MEKGPYMEYTKINGVAISFWEGKGTLMPQGTRTKTQELNQQFIELRDEHMEPNEQQNKKQEETPKTTMEAHETPTGGRKC